MRAILRVLSVMVPAALLGCANTGEDRLLTVSATGVLNGFSVFDANGSRTFDAPDDSMPGVRVHLLALYAPDTIASAVAGASGSFRMAGVPTGRYRVVVDTTPFAASVLDTVVVARLDSTQVTIPHGDSVSVNVLLGYPHVSVRAARTSVPPNRRVFIEGIALNATTTFRDTTLHVADTSAAIRAARPRPGAFAGQYDSVRVRGVTGGSRAGQPTLEDVAVFFVASAQLPLAVTLTTAAASSAQAGTLDARLVLVDSATVSDTATVTGGFRATVTDGSGALEVLLDVTAVPVPPALLVPGNVFQVVGVLVPTGTGVWRLKPRSAQDLVKQ